MVCTAYFGELCEARKTQWKQGDTNPYAVLISPVCLEGMGHDLLDVGSKYFRDKIQIDWGSFAWKCTPDEVYKFLNEHKTTLPWLVQKAEEIYGNVKIYVDNKGDTEYGIVFIEES